MRTSLLAFFVISATVGVLAFARYEASVGSSDIQPERRADDPISPKRRAGPGREGVLSGERGSPRTPIIALDSLPEEERGLTQEEATAIWATTMPMEEVLEFAQREIFGVSDEYRETFMAMNGSYVKQVGRAGLERRFGGSVDAALFTSLEIAEQPLNEDIAALASLYLGDLDHARKDIFASGRYQLEDRKEDGTFRKALPGESSWLFPGRALFWEIQDEDYPHLGEVMTEIATLKQQRLVLVRDQIARGY